MTCFDILPLKILWPLFVGAFLLALPPGRGLGENPLPSYLAILLLSGVILYRRIQSGRWVSGHTRSPCSECATDTTVDCLFCGAIRKTSSEARKFTRTYRALPFLAVAGIIYFLTMLDTREPGLGLSNAWRFYSGLFLSSAKSNAEIFLALTGIVIVFAVAYYAKRVDKKFEGVADCLLSDPDSLVAFESLRRARRLGRSALGQDAFNIARGFVPEMSSREFKEAVLKLQEIGSLEPAYSVRDGSILRGWKTNSP